jgi:hypothetical protein
LLFQVSIGLNLFREEALNLSTISRWSVHNPSLNAPFFFAGSPGRTTEISFLQACLEMGSTRLLQYFPLLSQVLFLQDGKVGINENGGSSLKLLPWILKLYCHLL